MAYETDLLERADLIERASHRVRALFGRHLGGEWFDGSVEDAKRAIEIATRQIQNNELILGGVLLPRKRQTMTPIEVFSHHFTREELAIARILGSDAELAMADEVTTNEHMFAPRGTNQDTPDRSRFYNVFRRLDRASKSTLIDLVLVPETATNAMKAVAKRRSKFGHAEAQKGVAIGLIKAALWHVGCVYEDLGYGADVVPERSLKLSRRRQAHGGAQSS